MTFWHRFLYLLGFSQESGSNYYALNENLQVSLEMLAEKEQCSTGDLIAILLSGALTQRHKAISLLQCWQSLTVRERDIAALICLGYTYLQMGESMHISIHTVKSHVRNVLHKFNLHNKSELRLVLSEWDFSAWIKKQD